MHSDCNVSFSKMPLSIHLCLNLLFGSISEKTAGMLVQSSIIYTEAAGLNVVLNVLQYKRNYSLLIELVKKELQQHIYQWMNQRKKEMH